MNHPGKSSRPGPQTPGRPRGDGGKSARRPRRANDGVWLYGVHTVLGALANPARRNKRLLATRNALDKHGLRSRAGATPLEIVAPAQLGRILPGDAVHQGLALETAPLREPALKDIAARGLAVVLDQVSDPQNFGAIMRCASAFGAHTIICTSRNSPPQSAALAKAASGALEQVDIVRVPNLAQALTMMKERGFAIIGLDCGASAPIDAVPHHDALALVLGAEGRGLRRLTRERCEHLARIDLPGAMEALNVSSAAAVALYALVRAARR